MDKDDTVKYFSQSAERVKLEDNHEVLLGQRGSSEFHEDADERDDGYEYLRADALGSGRQDYLAGRAGPETGRADYTDARY